MYRISLTYLLAVYGNMSAILATTPMVIATKVICETFKSRNMPWIATAVLLLYISMFQFTQSSQPGRRDFLICDNLTKPLTMLFVKLTTFCWNISDGRRPADKRSATQAGRAISKFPGVLEFASYAFFFPTLFAESHLDFLEFRRVIDEQTHGKADTVGIPKCTHVRKSSYNSVARLANGLAFECAFVYLSEIFPAESLFRNDFLSYGPIRQILQLHMVGIWGRLRGYGNWRLAEGGLIACGFSLESTETWVGLTNVNPLKVEFATNPRAYVNNYNTSIADWFKNHAYLRLETSREAAGMITFIYSALWHGFYPGFWLTFILAGIIQFVGRGKCLQAPETAIWLTLNLDLRRRFRQRFQQNAPSRVSYNVLSWLCTHLAFDFAVLPFILLTWNETMMVWSQLTGHLTFFRLVALLYAGLLLQKECSRLAGLLSTRSLSVKSQIGSRPHQFLQIPYNLGTSH